MSDGDRALPPVHDAMLDRATLDRLFFDIDAAGEVLSVHVKGGAEAYASEGPTLAEARDALVGRRVLGVQIRYRVDGVEWCDTLLAAGDGVRLVRIEMVA